MNQEETYKQLREKTSELSEIMLSAFDDIKSKEELEVFGKSYFGSLFSMFMRFAIQLEDRGLGPADALKVAGPLYLERIDAKIVKIMNG